MSYIQISGFLYCNMWDHDSPHSLKYVRAGKSYTVICSFSSRQKFDLKALHCFKTTVIYSKTRELEGSDKLLGRLFNKGEGNKGAKV